MKLIQRELYDQVESRTAAARDRITAMVRPLDPSKLAEHPEPGAWSVGQVLEHLCITFDLMEKSGRAAASRARADAGAPLREWHSSWFGGFIAKSLIRPKPVSAPAAFRPGPTPRGGVLEAMRSLDQALLQLMQDTKQLDWVAVRVKSPALPRWAPSYNLGDAFYIHTVHIERHAGQIERLLSS